MRETWLDSMACREKLVAEKSKLQLVTRPLMDSITFFKRLPYTSLSSNIVAVKTKSERRGLLPL